MKKIFLVVAITFSITLLAQTAEKSKKGVIPTDVKTAFAKEFPNNKATVELPANILEYLKKNYATNKITEAAKITDDKNVVTYEAEIGKDGKSYDVLFDFNGNFIKIVKGD